MFFVAVSPFHFAGLSAADYFSFRDSAT